MLLSCPNCQTEYDVPDAALTGRARTLRCSSCMTKWKAPALEMYREAPLPAPEPDQDVQVLSDAELAAEVVVNPDGQIVSLNDFDADTRAGTLAETTAETTADERLDESMAPDEPEIVEMPAPEPVFLTASRKVPVADEPAPQSKRGLQFSVFLVALIIVVALLLHKQIGGFWPPSLRVFNALGLH